MKKLEKLKELIKDYANNKRTKDEITKVCDKQNLEIKSSMEELNETSIEVEDIKATYYTSTKESFDDDKLVSLLKKYNLDNCIKLVEIPNMEMIEKEIYDGKISSSILKEMDKIRHTKVTTGLKITRK